MTQFCIYSVKKWYHVTESLRQYLFEIMIIVRNVVAAVRSCDRSEMYAPAARFKPFWTGNFDAIFGAFPLILRVINYGTAAFSYSCGFQNSNQNLI